MATTTTITKSTLAPEWVAAWLKIPFYEEKCRIHPKQYNAVFCGACMQRPLCPTCWENDSNEHRTHNPVLHVTRASRKAAVDVNEISELLEISGIKRFIINHRYIVYLNPFGQRPSSGDPKIPTCRTCSRKLGNSSDVDCRFCSIACKLNEDEHGMNDVQIGGKETLKGSLILRLKLPRKSFRKRSRKGIPRRSPLQ